MKHCVLNIGMAGSGKTTLMQQMASYKNNAFVMNLDPACYHMPYECTVDIRDTIDYKAVMEQYKLGPNGGIMTALNLFSTKFGQVLEVVDKSDADCVLVDTPGQIEIFTWSAAGNIITQSMVQEYPTVLVYVIDASKVMNPTTFMSNMLYACSILYRSAPGTKESSRDVRMVVVLNKIDLLEDKGQFALNWMEDFELFQEALMEDSSYMASLCMSMALALEEFYTMLKVVRVSSVTGEGIDKLFEAVDECVAEYKKEYISEAVDSKTNDQLTSFMTDLKVDK